MNGYQQNEQQLFQEVFQFENQGNRIDAIRKLDILIGFSPIKHFYCSVKARLLLELGRIEEAKGVIEEGLGYNNRDYILYKMKAEILYQYPRDYKDLELASQSIQMAHINFNAAQYLNKISKNIKDLDQLQTWILGSIENKSEITSLKIAIESSKKIWETYQKVLDVEAKMEKERINSIELLGIFTAILALVFSNVQAIIKEVKGVDLMWFNTGLIASLSWLLLIIGFIVSKDRPPLLKNYRFWALLFIGSVVGSGIYFLVLK